MKSKKLLKKLSELLSAEENLQRKEIKSIKRILKVLKRKDKSLREELERTSDSEKAVALQTKLDVIYAQRIKGVERVRCLLKDRDLPSG